MTVRTDGDVDASEPPRPNPPVPAKPRPRGLPAGAGLRWVAVDLHAHTLHSDGALTVAELAAEAVAAGLDALAVTDHNTVSHHAELAEVGRRYGIALIPGQEVTTEFGHANAFGDIGWVDFREPAANWVKTVRERGGLLSINHPLGGDCAWRHPLPEHPPLAEVWHSQLATPALGRPGRVVAGVGQRGHPDRRQRLAPPRRGRRARRPDHVGGGRLARAQRRRAGPRRAGGSARRPYGGVRGPARGRCCCRSTAR